MKLLIENGWAKSTGANRLMTYQTSILCCINRKMNSHGYPLEQIHIGPNSLYLPT